MRNKEPAGIRKAAASSLVWRRNPVPCRRREPFSSSQSLQARNFNVTSKMTSFSADIRHRESSEEFHLTLLTKASTFRKCEYFYTFVHYIKLQCNYSIEENNFAKKGICNVNVTEEKNDYNYCREKTVVVEYVWDDEIPRIS